MDIQLKSANDVPGIFVERLESRLADERALVTTMSLDFAENPITAGLIEHGTADDVFAPDYYGHSNGTSSRLGGNTDHEQAREEFERDFPGSYVVIGEPQTDSKLEKRYQGSIYNRSHIKAYAVGSKILSLGGVNATGFNYEACIDAMLDFDSPEFADFLHLFVENDGNLRGREGSGGVMHLDDENMIIVDWGKEGESLIMESLYHDLASDEISSVNMSSSYPPAGHILSALRRIVASDGEANIYTNSLRKFKRPHQSIGEKRMQRQDLLGITIGNVIFDRNRPVRIVDCILDDKFNHFKSVSIKFRDGRQVAYMGSHNFHPFSVGFGTAEATLRTTDESVIGQVDSFIANNLAPSRDRRIGWLFGLRDIPAYLLSG